MVKETIFQHKEEKKQMLKKSFVEREILLSLKRELTHPLIKVITGPRRAGKSVACFLLLKKKKFAYLNFDDENLLRVNNYDRLLEAMFAVYGQVEYLFFDEIQNLPQWELFVNKLHRRGYKIIITGSNAKLLSRELSSALTGRFLEYTLLPFSLTEYLTAKNIFLAAEDYSLPEKRGQFFRWLNRYLLEGGYPEPATTTINYQKYLATLFDSVLFKDIVGRYEIRTAKKLDNLASYLAANFTKYFTYNSLKNILGFAHTSTVEEYLNYLVEAWLFFVLPIFSFKVKEHIKSPRKIYLVDNGFVAAKGFQFSPNQGRLLENAVFLHFVRQEYKVGQDLFYYATGDYEVDFVLKKGAKIKSLWQVCFDFSLPKVREREIKGLIKASRDLSCSNLNIVTYSEEGEERVEGKKIKIIPSYKFFHSRI